MVEVNLFDQAMKLRQAADTIGYILNDFKYKDLIYPGAGFDDAFTTAMLVLRAVAEDLICPRRVVEREAKRAPETGQGPAHQQTVDRRPEAIWGEPWPERPGRWMVELDETEEDEDFPPVDFHLVGHIDDLGNSL
jgi:hypothetical protein